MALVNCHECTAQISNQANACPRCGYPITENTALSQKNERLNVVIVKSAKNRGVYIILGLFLGCLGIHNFYAGYNGRGATQLLISLVLGWIIIGLIITCLWS